LFINLLQLEHTGCAFAAQIAFNFAAFASSNDAGAAFRKLNGNRCAASQGEHRGSPTHAMIDAAAKENVYKRTA
jgi:hypothetical protein